MKVHRRLLRDIDCAAIARLVGSCFFASPGFAKVWSAKGGRPVAWVAEDEGRPAAVLPGVEFGGGRLCRFQAMPDGCYGGVFFDGGYDADRGRVSRLIIDAIVRRNYVKAFLTDYYNTLPKDSRFRPVRCTTTLVDISDDDWSPPDKKLVSQIRKASREGVRVESLNWDRHRNGFLQLVRRVEARRGRPPLYNEGFFDALARLYAIDDRVHWLWCEYDGHPVCSHIYFIEKGVLQGWQKYLDRDFSFLKADQLARFTMCRRMARQGICVLNLGATPRGALGLARYKKRWGGEPVHYKCYVRKTGVGRVIKERRRFHA